MTVSSTERVFEPTSVARLLGTVLDDGRFEPWLDEGATTTPEAVVVGEGRLGGRRVAVIASDFGFLGGSIGVDATARIVRTVRRATAEGLPLLASPASGGTRMQDGTRAFVGMRDIAAAVAAHRGAGLLYLVWLRHPTFGGALASWGSLAHLTVAEPGAAVGFLGPRVYSALRGQQFPPGVQQAENLRSCGLVDAVLPLHRLRTEALRLLDLVLPVAGSVPTRRVCSAGATRVRDDDSAWQAVVASRRATRPGLRDVLDHVRCDVVELSGTGHGETATGIVLAFARFADTPCVLVGQDRGAQRSQPIGPAALRVARRGFRLADELRMPLVTVVDTPGADLSPAAEEGGLAAEIAGCLADLSQLREPSLCVLLGEGGGGAALALTATRRVIAASHAWLAALPPEAASTLVHRTVDRACAVADQQGIGAHQLLAAGIVHGIVDETPDAADESDAFARRLVHRIGTELATLTAP